MRNKKAALALLLILPFVLTACSLQDLPLIGKYFQKAGDGGSSSSDAAANLTFWGLWEEPEVMADVISKYQENHPNVTINYDDRSIVDVSDYRAALFNRASQEGAPDIALVHNSWVSRLQGSLVPASNIDSGFVSENMYPIVTSDAVLNGEVYAIPMYYDGLALIYNKAHFREIDQVNPPTAWEEFRKLALQLTVYSEERGSANEIVRAGAAIGAANNIDFFSDILGLMFSQAGIAIPDDLDSSPAADALTFYTNFASKDKVWSASFPEAATAFAQEKVSMMFAPSWVVLDILAVRPDLEIGVAPVPQVSIAEETPADWASYWMVAVPSGGDSPAQAWEFIKFLTEETTQLAYFSKASEYRSFGPAYSLKSLAGQIAPGSVLEAYISMASSAKSGVVAGRAGNKDQVDALRTAVNLVLDNSKDSGTALTEAKTVMMSTQ